MEVLRTNSNLQRKCAFLGVYPARAIISRGLMGVVLGFSLFGTPALSAANLSGAQKTALRQAIETAPSGNWIGAPSIEKRIEAGLIFLRAEGYYGARIDIVEPGAEPDIGQGFIVDVAEDQRKLLVQAGPQFTIVDVNLNLIGESSPDLEMARREARSRTSALAGNAARSSDVLVVQSQALAAVKEAGFTDAEQEDADIIVDHATRTMTINFAVKTGPLTTLRAVTVTGADQTPANWVERAADIKVGAAATGDRLRKIAERLRTTGAYQNTDLSLVPSDPANPGSGRSNLAITLEERTKRTWSAGAVWSTSEGLGLDASTSFFHRFHQADTLTFDGRLGTVDSSLGTSLRLPGFRGAGRDLLLEARAGQEATDAYTRLLARLSANYALPRGRKDILTYGVGVDFTRTRTPLQAEFGLDPRFIDGADVSFRIRYDRDRADDLIDPTSGWRAQGEIQPSIFIGNGETIPYTRLVVGGALYRGIDGLRDGVLAGRLKAGLLFTGNDQLPFDRKFFGGGGGSVRGYPFQSIGPRDSNDDPIGGTSLLEASLEARWALRGPFGVAVFADAARVGAIDEFEEQQTKVGVGIGLRYDLGIAPLRVDLAFPLNRRDGDPPVQIYLSAGQSF